MTALTQTGRPLAELVTALERADDTADVARALAVEGQRLVLQGFESGRSPSGERWAPLKRPRFGLGGPLWRSGDLREQAAQPVITAGGFVMTAPEPKAVHQHGSTKRRLPARPFYPDSTLSPTWERALSIAADGAIRIPDE